MRVAPGIAADVVVDFGAALGRGVGGVEHAISRCDDAGRRSQLRAFAGAVNGLPSVEQERIAAALDEIQVRSKLWLIDELERLRDLSNCRLLVLGAWCGVLPLLCNWTLAHPPRHMVCVDIDAGACAVGVRVIGAHYENVGYRCADVMGFDYEPWARDPTTVVVNTICEHLPDVAGWWRGIGSGQFVVLQSNNYFGCPDHVNAIRSTAELLAQSPLSDVLFEGVLELSLFDRYMVIGRR